MASLQSWRRAYGALKDSTTVGLATLSGDRKELHVAIVKATNHVECPPKERHLRRILLATSASRPREDVAYCVRAIRRRLARTRNWTVALKALIVVQRTLRDGDPTFREELLKIPKELCLLQLSNFKDDSSPIAWDCSAWIRAYALYLEEKLECFKVLKYEVESERLTHPSDGTSKGYSKTRTLGTRDLLNQLPALQLLLYRLIGCRPEGTAANSHLIQYALALVLKESFKIYCAINDGIINLVEKFFEMPRLEALEAVGIYQRAGQQAGSLSNFYEDCRSIEMARNFQFPQLREPPQSFLKAMEEYVMKDAPRMIPVLKEPSESPERLLVTYKPEDAPQTEVAKGLQSGLEDLKIKPVPVVEEASPKPDDGDLLRLSFSMDASEVQESNSLALAIASPDTNASNKMDAGQVNGLGLTGWELALVTTSNEFSAESKLAGELDKMMLDDLFDESAFRQQPQPLHAARWNPFVSPDPFMASNQMLPPPSLQLGAMPQEQDFHTLPVAMQTNPFSFSPAIALPPHSVTGGNPFSNLGSGPMAANHAHLPSNNPFGSPSLL